ncbi:MAG: arginine N-succinyltransferase [Deltaproteobacteria bacterium]|nr:arginine N-succinyltransferase [Deltaproteobacteria bacterium]
MRDQGDLLRLANSLSAHGFLTLPSQEKELEQLMGDEGKILFVLEEVASKKVIGSSLIVARHGTPVSPHLYFQVDPLRRTLQLKFETKGRTELGGLILDPAYRGGKLGKKLSYVRLYYLAQHPKGFQNDILAELLPPFNPDGSSLLWEALGKKFTGMEYRDADQRAREDKQFVRDHFPAHEILIDSLPHEAQLILGQPGPETKAVAKMLMEVGFHYLDQIDPFDGGPHYGAKQEEIKQDLVRDVLFSETKVKIEI